MNTFFTEVCQTLVPRGEVKHGPLPPLLLAMTLVTGLVDAFSFLTLGHVFVANMTGNVVILGFALAGAPGFSIPASAAALAAFVFGAVAGGHIAARMGHHRGRLLGAATRRLSSFPPRSSWRGEAVSRSRRTVIRSSWSSASRWACRTRRSQAGGTRHDQNRP